MSLRDELRVLVLTAALGAEIVALHAASLDAQAVMVTAAIVSLLAMFAYGVVTERNTSA